MSGTIPRDRLDLAAVAVRRVLTSKDFKHTFFGGYELMLMGSPRGTKDIDVVVSKPWFRGFQKVKRAFVKDPEFLVFDGNRTDGIRAIHSPSGVGIDIMLMPLPKSHITLANDTNFLPLFPPTDLLIRKIICLAERHKESDETDLIFLYNNFALNWVLINKKVTAPQRDAALQAHNNNPQVEEILNKLNVK